MIMTFKNKEELKKHLNSHSEVITTKGNLMEIDGLRCLSWLVIERSRYGERLTEEEFKELSDSTIIEISRCVETYYDYDEDGRDCSYDQRKDNIVIL